MSALRGKKVDSIPWVPRIDLWYNTHKKQGTLPVEFRHDSIWDILRKLGLAMYCRRGRVYKERIENLKIRVLLGKEVYRDEVFPRYSSTLLRIEGRIENLPIKFLRDSSTTNNIFIEYITPKGTVSTRFGYPQQLRAAGVAPYQTEYMIKDLRDYEVVKYIIEHKEPFPDYSDYIQAQKEVGDDGVVFTSHFWSPIHQLMLVYLGYEKFFYELYDHPNKIEELLQLLTWYTRKIQRICADSLAQLIQFGGNFDSTIVSPTLFRKYFVPYFREFSQLLHSKGKILISHTDGEMKGLLEVFPESEIDVAEAFTPSPGTNCTLSEARRIWKKRVVIWGGIPSIVLSQSTSDLKFKQFMQELFVEVSPGDCFILGVGDNTPPDAKLERLTQIAEMVKTHGKIN